MFLVLPGFRTCPPLPIHPLPPSYEAHHKLRYTDEALMAAAKYSSQYISDRFLPDKVRWCCAPPRSGGSGLERLLAVAGGSRPPLRLAPLLAHPASRTAPLSPRSGA